MAYNPAFFSLLVPPGDRYSRVVFTSAGGETLWNLPAIKSMCNIDNSRVRKVNRKGGCLAQTRSYFCDCGPLSPASERMAPLKRLAPRDVRAGGPASAPVTSRIEAPVCFPACETPRLSE